MLKKFSIKNYRSFKDVQTFSMVASRERRDSDRLIHLTKSKQRLVPVAMLQGKNGAGKSNFITAIEKAVSLILRTPKNRESFGVNPFRLASNMDQEPTEFSFEFVVQGLTYRYLFAISNSEVIEENLSELRVVGEIPKFKRIRQSIDTSGLTQLEVEQGDLRIIAQGTRSNHLFLNVLAQQAENVPSYSWSRGITNIYQWFSEDVVFISPRVSLERESSSMLNRLSKIMPTFDTGIDSVDLVKLPRDLFRDQEIIKRLAEIIPEGESMSFPLFGADGRLITIRKINGEVVPCEIQISHKAEGGEAVTFQMNEESEGTVRLLSMLPSLIALAVGERPKLVLVDEIDRSLHTLLTQKLIRDFLLWAKYQTGAQLIFTTHDAGLMKCLGLRRDEMWIVGRENNTATQLIRLSDGNAKNAKDSEGLRTGKDLLDLYLKGALGGVAEFGNGSYLEIAKNNN